MLSLSSKPAVDQNTTACVSATARNIQLTEGRGCSSVGGASDRNAAEGRFNSPVRLRIFLPESTFSADSLTLSVQPSCAITRINICAHVEDPKHWQPCLCLDT